jgi:hypothetical protein
MYAHLVRELPQFLLACLILAALPGPASLLCPHRTLRDGRTAGLAAVAGNEGVRDLVPAAVLAPQRPAGPDPYRAGEHPSARRQRLEHGPGAAHRPRQDVLAPRQRQQAAATCPRRGPHPARAGARRRHAIGASRRPGEGTDAGDRGSGRSGDRGVVRAAGTNGPQAVHVHGVQSVIAAAAPTVPIVLVTQIYITRPRRSSRGVHRPSPMLTDDRPLWGASGGATTSCRGKSCISERTCAPPPRRAGQLASSPEGAGEQFPGAVSNPPPFVRGIGSGPDPSK